MTDRIDDESISLTAAGMRQAYGSQAEAERARLIEKHKLRGDRLGEETWQRVAKAIRNTELPKSDPMRL